LFYERRGEKTAGGGRIAFEPIEDKEEFENRQDAKAPRKALSKAWPGLSLAPWRLGG
jgi:hypothetical protein